MAFAKGIGKAEVVSKKGKKKTIPQHEIPNGKVMATQLRILRDLMQRVKHVAVDNGLSANAMICKLLVEALEARGA